MSTLPQPMGHVVMWVPMCIRTSLEEVDKAARSVESIKGREDLSYQEYKFLSGFRLGILRAYLSPSGSGFPVICYGRAFLEEVQSNQVASWKGLAKRLRNMLLMCGVIEPYEPLRLTIRSGSAEMTFFVGTGRGKQLCHARDPWMTTVILDELFQSENKEG